MPDTRLLVEIDGEQLGDTGLRSLVEVQTEEALTIADAATLVARLEPGEDGTWTSVLDPLLTPATPVVVQVARGEDQYRFDGRSTQASWNIDPEGTSRLTIVAVDRTVDLDSEEKIVAWPGTTDSAIVETIFSSYGFVPEVEATPDSADPDVHVLLQRASDLAFVRALAEKWGYDTFLEASERGITGHFRTVDPLADPQGELALGFGADAQRVTGTASLVDSERVKVSRIPALSDSPQTGDSAGDDQAQGARSLAGGTTTLLTPAEVSGEVDPAAVARSLARRSAFSAQLSVEVDADRVGRLFRARRPVLVKGLGNTLSGRYLVGSVRHVVTLERHRMQLTLVRNALGLTGDEPFGAASGMGGLL